MREGKRVRGREVGRGNEGREEGRKGGREEGNVSIHTSDPIIFINPIRTIFSRRCKYRKSDTRERTALIVNDEKEVMIRVNRREKIRKKMRKIS